MRTLSTLLMAMTIAAMSASVWAQERDGAPAQRRGQMRDRAGATSRPAQNTEQVQKLVESFNLPPKKQERVERILQTTHKALADLQSQRQELTGRADQDRPRARQQDQDAEPAAREKANEQRQQLARKHQEILDRTEKQLSQVLTPDQVTQVLGLLQGPRRAAGAGGLMNPEMAERLGLTPEQRQQMRTILQEARKEAQASDDRAKRRQIMQAAQEKIRTEVLTAEQRRKLQQMDLATGPQGERQMRRGEQPRPQADAPDADERPRGRQRGQDRPARAAD